MKKLLNMIFSNLTVKHFSNNFQPERARNSNIESGTLLNRWNPISNINLTSHVRVDESFTIQHCGDLAFQEIDINLLDSGLSIC